MFEIRTCEHSAVLQRDLNGRPRLVEDDVSVGQDEAVVADDETWNRFLILSS